MRLREWIFQTGVLLTFGALGSAVAFAYREDWTWASVAAAVVLVPVAGWVRAEFAAARAMLRKLPATGKHHKARVRAYVCSRCGEPGLTTWDSEEAAARAVELGVPLACDKCFAGTLRMVAR